MLSKSFPLRLPITPRPHFLPKCSSKLPPGDLPRPFLLILRRPLTRKNKSQIESWQSACFSGAVTSARLPAANIKQRPYRFLAVIRPLPGDGTAGSSSCVLTVRGAGAQPRSHGAHGTLVSTARTWEASRRLRARSSLPRIDSGALRLNFGASSPSRSRPFKHG